EFRRANNYLPASTLAGATDVSFPAPGLPLVFVRAFDQSLTRRYRLGALGRGWTHTWDVSTTTDGQGNVTIHAAGARRFFARQADGTYRGTPGEFATLTLVSGEYRLRETDGTVIAFRSDGKLSYMEDANGNRVTAGYTGAQLTSLVHSSGQRLVLSYNAQGRIGQLTDPAERITTYGYDPSGEHLVSVSGPGGLTRYTYVTGGGTAR